MQLDQHLLKCREKFCFGFDKVWVNIIAFVIGE
jgi:hypothetical protein